MAIDILKDAGPTLKTRLLEMQGMLIGYIKNSGPGIVELTVAEAKDLEELLDEFHGLLEKVEKLTKIKKLRKKS